MKIAVQGIAVIAPGLNDWPQAREVLAGRAPLVVADSVVPPAARLPATERRRVGKSVKVALALAEQLFSVEGVPLAADTTTIFTSSGGDGENCHSLCEALEAEQPMLSPTRFTNSVHNAPAGYWSIAAHCQRPSSSLCGYDASFAAGLIEAAVHVLSEHEPVALIAYDLPYPEPLNAKRPLQGTGGIALLLAPLGSANNIATLEFDAYVHGEPSRMGQAQLDRMAAGLPALRGLPLLESIALERNGSVNLGGNGSQVLRVDVVPLAVR